jgi:Cu/Zn superoxide dismutase
MQAKAPKNNGKNEKNVVELKAMIDSDFFKGTVTVKQKQKQRKGNKGRQQITNAKWKIDIDEIDADICKNACDNCDNPETTLNWHVHERAIPEDGSCGDAGGHWDPTFGCGGASQYQGDNGVCALLANNVPGRVIKQTCEPIEDITACEMGDLSSKMGQVEISEGRQRFSDEYISNLDNIKDLSIVFHCGGPRVACGNFELMD